MAEEKEEIQEEEVVPEEKPEIEPEEEQKEDKSLQSALAQKDHYKSKAEKAEARTQELEKSLKKDNTSLPQDPIEIVKLSKALGGYNEAETDFIIRNSDGTLDGIIKATSDDWVQSAITSKREKVAKENEIPAPSSPRQKIDEDYSKNLSEAVKGNDRDNIQKIIEKRVADLEAAENRGNAGI
ncbi:MAG: hypothetical protein ACTSUF_11215 [Candidatus Heimdallarchaeaceae archaeon]